MKKKIVISIIILIFVTVVYAADVKWTALAELTTVADVDVLCIVDDPAGTPASKKITVLNLFDTIDTFAELNTIVADKTLVNEEDAVTWDALGTFGLGITITTGDPFTLGTNRIDNGSDLLDGEMIGADTIDDDSLDFADITGVDLTLTDCGAITSTGTITATVGFDIVGAADIDYGSVDITDHTFLTDGTGTAEIVLPAGSIDGTEILDDTLDSADYAAGSIDEEHLNATNAPGAGEDNYVLTYNHAGLNFTWAADATGGNTAWDDIGNPDADDTIDMGAYIIGLDVNDFRVGAVDAGNYMKIAGNATTFVGTGDIDLPDDSVDAGDINFNYATSGSEGGSAASGDSATAFFSAGTIEHEYGGLEADVSSYTGLVAISGGSTAEIDSKSELEGQIADVADFAEADGDIYSGVHDFGGATTIVPWKVNATAAPTVEGQAIWESDTDELTVGDGSVSIVIAAKTKTIFAFNIHDIDTGMDDIKMPFTRAVVITKVTAFVTGGTNVVGRLYEVDGDGDDADAVGVESSDWTFTTGETEDSSFNNATFDAGDYIQWDTTSVSGSVTGFMISVEGYEI